jgi:hypothetical protein
MKALISSIEIKEQGYRVAEIHETGFEVAYPLFWVDCPDDLIADSKWFDPIDNTFKEFPPPTFLEENNIKTTGTQSI